MSLNSQMIYIGACSRSIYSGSNAENRQVGQGQLGLFKRARMIKRTWLRVDASAYVCRPVPQVLPSREAWRFRMEWLLLRFGTHVFVLTFSPRLSYLTQMRVTDRSGGGMRLLRFHDTLACYSLQGDKEVSGFLCICKLLLCFRNRNVLSGSLF